MGVHYRRHAWAAAGAVVLALAVTAMGTPAAVEAVACDLKLSLVGETPTDNDLTVREWEDFQVHGFGLLPNTSVTIAFERADAWATFDATTDDSGSFVETFYFESDELPYWRVGAFYDPTTWCDDGVGVWVVAGTPFTDIASSGFQREIAWLYQAGITTGCAATLYCPKSGVSREQMASFLARALELPAATTDYFTDDETSMHEDNINRVAAAGITTGCTPTTYCPKGGVTREQMASFLARALGLPPTGTDYFTDDETSTHEDNINRLAGAGITTGCTPTTYCPKSGVTREQMAAFLYRALAE